MPIDDESVEFDLDDGKASLRVSHQRLLDYFDVPNALAEGRSVPAEASFVVQWEAEGKETEVSSTEHGFAGVFREGTATIRWSAKEEGFVFVSDPSATSKSSFSVIGTERNGVFL